MGKEKNPENNRHSTTPNSLFWADQLTERIIKRKRYHYLNKKIKKLDTFVVKTSASMSGVLHIGRLSDTIRGDSVFRALKDKGVKAKLIWVAEDMDPLRKVPNGVPKEFKDYLGMPVTDIPDPFGTHKNYAEHFKSEYLKVLKKFIHADLEVYSMREEYKKGAFKPFIKKAMENIDLIKSILNKYRDNKLADGWSPWVPVCKKCGKIATTKVIGVEDGKVHYVCEDYNFKSSKAKGCGYEGWADPLKDDGKLMWKSEWAAQWLRWGVVSEGAGKEYQVPNSAFWVNAEIAERVFDYPMPEPIFYEHLMIDDIKMSASLGNVVYPRDWLEIAPPDLLRFYYNKRLMKTRSFSWKDLPQIYDEFDNAARVYLNIVNLKNKKEEQHIKRLYEISALKYEKPLKMSFSHAVVLAQITNNKERIIKSLSETGHYGEEFKKRIFDRINYARTWIKKYAPEQYKFELQIKPKIKLNEQDKKIVEEIIRRIKQKDMDEKALHAEFYEIINKYNSNPKDFFNLVYRILLNKERGPRLASFLITLGDKAVNILEKAVEQ